MKETISKKNFLKIMDTLPEEILVDELFDRILLQQKIEQGLSDIENGAIISHEDVKKRLNKWLK